MYKVGPGNQGVGGFVFAGVIVGTGGFLGRAAGAAAFAVENVHDIVVRLVQKALREEGKDVLVAAVTVDDDDFFASVAGHLVGGFLQELQLEFAGVSDGSGFVLGLKNLAKVVFRKDQGVVLLGGVQRGVTHIEQIGAQREMLAVLFQDAEREQAGALSLAYRGGKIGRGQFFPFHGELGLRARGGAQKQKHADGEECFWPLVPPD